MKILLILILAKSVFPLECHRCVVTSLYPNPKCIGPDIEASSVTCKFNQICSVKRSTYLIGHFWKWKIERGCSDIKKDKCFETAGHHEYVCEYLCDTNYCNTSNGFLLTVPQPIFLIFFLILFMFCCL